MKPVFVSAALLTAVSAGAAAAAPFHYSPTFGRGNGFMTDVDQRPLRPRADRAEVTMAGHFGHALPAETPARIVTLVPGLRFVNVTQDDVVRFMVGDRAFHWKFATHTMAPFDLARIAPPGFLPPRAEVMIYIEPNPLYQGGG